MKRYIRGILGGILGHTAYATKREQALLLELSQVKDQLGSITARAEAETTRADAAMTLAEERVGLIAAAAARAERVEKQLGLERELKRELAAKHTVLDFGSSEPASVNPEAIPRIRSIMQGWLDVTFTKQFVADVSAPRSMGNLQFNDVFHHLIAPFFQPGQSIIDVGCGPGLTSIFLHDRGCNMVGVDYSQEMLKRLLELRNGRNIAVRQGDAFSLPAKDEEFDGAVSRMFVTLFPEFYLILKEMTRVVKPGSLIAYTFANAEQFQAASRCPYPDASALRRGSYASMIDRPHLEYLCEAIECDVVNVFPMGWLFNNVLVAFSLGNERFEAFERTLSEYLQRSDVFEFMSWLDKEITPNMPPATSSQNVTILRKR